MRSPKPVPSQSQQHPVIPQTDITRIYSPSTSCYYHPPSPQPHHHPNLPHQTSLNIASNPLRLHTIDGYHPAHQEPEARSGPTNQGRRISSPHHYLRRNTRRSESVPTFSVQFQDKKFETALLPTLLTTGDNSAEAIEYQLPEEPISGEAGAHQKENENQTKFAKKLSSENKKREDKSAIPVKSRPSSPTKKSSSTSFLQRMGQKLSIDFHGSFQIVMLGLDNAGKSTTLYRLKMDNFIQAPPTIGFNCEKFKPSEGRSKGCLFTIWDVGGQEKLRPLWRSYVRHTDAIVFVVDSTDKDRFEEAKLELSNLMRCPDIPATVPILLVANKQDLPSAFSEEEVMAAVGVTELSPSHPNQILSCCAVTGEGLDGIFFDSLHELVINARKLDKGRKKSTAK